MFAFILQRLIQAVIVMVSVAFISFLLFQFVGDPVVFLLGQDATPDQIRELRADLGLDKSFVVQFWNFLANAVQGEFGLSLRQGAKVSRLIAERFPATLELAFVAAAVLPIASATATQPSGISSIAARVLRGEDQESTVARSSRVGVKRRVKAGPTMRFA